MGRVINTTLDGGMRGPRGQYRDSADNETLNLENLLVERDGTLRNRPAIQGFRHTLLPTDKILPFDWKGKRMFLVYDPLYEFKWKADEFWVRNLTTNTALVNPSTKDYWYESFGGSPHHCRNLMTNNFMFNPAVPYDTNVSRLLLTLLTGRVYRGDTDWMTRLYTAVMYRFDSRVKNRTGTAYMGFYLASLAAAQRIPFYIFDRVSALNGGTIVYAGVAHVRPLRGVLDRPMQFWHRIFIMDEKGMIRCNGCIRGMPLSYEPSYKRYDSVSEQPYNADTLGTHIENLYTAKRSTNRRFKVSLEYGSGVRADYRYNGKSQYLMAEGINNNIVYDPEGVMPPLVIEGDESGDRLGLMELPLKFAYTGLSRRFFPSWLTSDEQDRDVVWKSNHDTFDPPISTSQPYYGGANAVDTVARATGSSFTPVSVDDLKNIRDAWGAKTLSDSRTFREGTTEEFVPDNATSTSDLPVNSSLIQSGTISDAYLKLKTHSYSSPGRSIPGPGVCRLRYNTLSGTANVAGTNRHNPDSRSQGFRPVASPFFEQNPVVRWQSYRTYRVRPRPIAERFDILQIGRGSGTLRVNGWMFAEPSWFISAAHESIDKTEYWDNTERKQKSYSGNLIDFWHVRPARTTDPVFAFEGLKGTTEFNPNLLKRNVRLLREREYYRHIGFPCWGLTPGNYFKSVSAQTNRYVFSEGPNVENIIYVTSTSSQRRTAENLRNEEGTVVVTVQPINGPDRGVFSFSSYERLNASPREPLGDFGYTQPLSVEGGVRVSWVSVLPVQGAGRQLALGTTAGKLYLESLELDAFNNQTVDPSDSPSQVVPVVLNNLLFQTMSDNEQVYIIESSRDSRNTWRSASAPIADIFGGRITWLGGLADTGRLLVLTREGPEGGRLFCGLLDTDGNPRWSEITVGEGRTPISEVHKVGSDLFLSYGGNIGVLNLNTGGDIEDGANLVLELKHPSSYAMQDAEKGITSFNHKYSKGWLLGVFKSGDSPDEVRIGTRERPGALSSPRSIHDVQFGGVNLESKNDGLRFDFAARNIEIDSLSMEVRD